MCAHCRAKLAAVNDNWWEASDGVLYPPHAHPDFGRRPLKPAPPRKRWSTRTRILVGVAVAIGIGLWGWVAATSPESDLDAEQACDEFYDLRDADLYTDAELREQVQQIWDDAQYSENADVRVSARQLLQAVTTGDVDLYVLSVADMRDACNELDT